MHGLGLLVLLAGGALAVAVAYAAQRALLRDAPTTLVVSLPFQSGARPQEHALSRYHVRWYALTLLFLAFDVEMLFMYPWALVVAVEGIGSVVEMFVFLGVLGVGVLWARREGALRWV